MVPYSDSGMVKRKDEDTHVIYRSTKQDELAFILGVTNVIFSTWLISVFPQHYFLWHCVKNSTLLLKNFQTKKKRKEQYFLVDFCYVANVTSFLYFGICLCKRYDFLGTGGKEYASFQHLLQQYLNPFGDIVFRVLWTWVNGPCLCAVAALRNSLVFHNEGHMTILAVHMGPALALYGMKWWHQSLEQAYPETFHFDPTKHLEYFEILLYHILIPFLCYLFIWAIPYFFFIFVIADKYIKEKHLKTVYGSLEKNFVTTYEYLHVPEGIYRPVVYMCFHGLLSLISFCISTVVWQSFYLHTCYLLFMVFVSTKNGASYYFKVFARKYQKSLIIDGDSDDDMDQEMKEKTR